MEKYLFGFVDGKVIKPDSEALCSTRFIWRYVMNAERIFFESLGFFPSKNEFPFAPGGYAK